MACGGSTSKVTTKLIDLADVTTTGIAQGMILQVDQNCMHVYVDPCDIFEACQNSYTEFIELTDCPNSYTAKALNLVRVNAGATGLEFATPAQAFSTLNFVDKYVQVNVGGVAGYLEDKLSAGLGIQLNVVTDTIEIAIDTTTFPIVLQNFTDLLDCPASYAGHGGEILAVNAGESGVEFISGMQAHPSRGRRFTNADKKYSFAINSGLQGSYLADFNSFYGNDPDGTKYMEYAAYDFPIGGGFTTKTLRVPKTGVYDASIRGTLKINSRVQAVRVFLVSTTGTVVSSACDCKYGNQFFDADTRTDQDVYVDFSKNMKLQLDKDTVLVMAMLVYTDFPPNRGPQNATGLPTTADVTVLFTNFTNFGIRDRGTSFELARYGDSDTYYETP